MNTTTQNKEKAALAVQIPVSDLRDYFAAKAMQGLMGRVWGELEAEELFQVWSSSAYAVADAMLRAREAK